MIEGWILDKIEPHKRAPLIILRDPQRVIRPGAHIVDGWAEENGFSVLFCAGNLALREMVEAIRDDAETRVLVVDRSGFEVLSESRDGAKVISEEKVASYTRSHGVVQNHMKRFLECVRTRKTPEADILVGHHATNPGHLMNISWRAGRRVRWDAAEERIIDDPEASKWLRARITKT